MKESNCICKKTYAGIDSFRLIAAFMVIAIHVAPLSVLNEDIDYLFTYCLGRVAVPFFFMTTGYFVLAPYVKSDCKYKASIRRYLLKNTLLYLLVSILYFPLSLYSGNVPKTLLALIRWLLFDGTFYHLWYFPAAIIGCVLLIFLLKKSMKMAICFSLLAYVIGVFGDSYYGLAWKIPFLRSLYSGIFCVSSYTRNGIFFAPLYLLLGTLLAFPKFRCHEKICRGGLLLSLFLMLFEGWMTYSFHLSRHNSMYLFLLPVLYFLFQLLLELSIVASKDTLKWLRKASMMLYVLHPAVIIVLRGIAKVTKLTYILIDNSLIQYVAVCLLSLVTVRICTLPVLGRCKTPNPTYMKGE